jgi:hypothetical protein
MVSVPRTVHRSAEISVALPRDLTMALFTAEGEREWAADGWDPQFATAERQDGPGAVFTTGHAGRTTWVMVDHRPDYIRYARATEGLTAGTIAIEVVATDVHATRVRVTYDLTALATEGEQWLAEFDAGYDAEIASWAKDIARAIEQRGRGQ